MAPCVVEQPINTYQQPINNILNVRVYASRLLVFRTGKDTWEEDPGKTQTIQPRRFYLYVRQGGGVYPFSVLHGGPMHVDDDNGVHVGVALDPRLHCLESFVGPFSPFGGFRARDDNEVVGET